MEDLYQYVAVEHFATGEGRIIYLLITRALPSSYDDYEIKPSFTQDGYDPGKLKTTAEQRAIREMIDYAGNYLGIGAKVYSRDEFFNRFNHMIPQSVKDLTDCNSKQPGPSNLKFQSMVYYNFS